jgi:hypothetical protein
VSTGRLAGKRTDETAKTEIEQHLFLEPTLEDDGDVVTTPFGMIQRSVDSW